MTDAKKKEVTSIRVDPDLWKEVRIESIRHDLEVSEFTERALKRELEYIRGRKPS